MMMQEMGAAWDLARKAVAKAQKQQKHHHDKKAKNANFKIGERVFVRMPAVQTGPLRKLSRPFKGPYRVTALYPNGADVLLIGKPRSDPIRVSLNRLRWCPEEIQEDLPSNLVTPEGSPPGNTEFDLPPDRETPEGSTPGNTEFDLPLDWKTPEERIHINVLADSETSEESRPSSALRQRPERAEVIPCHPERNRPHSIRRPNVTDQPFLWRSRLRPRKISSRTNQAGAGEM